MANAPHGGELKDLHVRDAPIKQQLAQEAESLPHLRLSERHLWSVPLLAARSWSPQADTRTKVTSSSS